MRKIMEKLARSNPKAMDVLYKAYGPKVHYMALELTGSKAVAETVTEEIFAQLWEIMPEEKFTEVEELERYTLKLVARDCCKLLYKDDPTAFKCHNFSKGITFPKERKEFDGNLKLSLNCFRSAVRSLDEYESTALKLMIFGVNMGDMAEAMGVEGTVAGCYVEEAVAKLNRGLGAMKEDGRMGVPEVIELYSLFEQAAQKTPVPSAVEAAVYGGIKEFAKPSLVPVMLVIPTVAVLALAALVAVMSWGSNNSHENEAVSTDSSADAAVSDELWESEVEVSLTSSYNSES